MGAPTGFTSVRHGRFAAMSRMLGQRWYLFQRIFDPGELPIRGQLVAVRLGPFAG